MLAWPVIAVVAATLFFTLFVRMKDIPAPDPVPPARHLEERKAAIYENLRDLQFEYRLGKLSDDDYQKSKLGLQKELAVVIAEINRITAEAAQPGSQPASQPSSQPASQPAKSKAAAVRVEAPADAAKADAGETEMADGTVCPHCGAKFARSMKFCGECGKAIS